MGNFELWRNARRRAVECARVRVLVFFSGKGFLETYVPTDL